MTTTTPTNTRFSDAEVLKALLSSKAPQPKVRAFNLKLARTAIGIGAKLDLNTRKQSKTIIAELQEFLAAEENCYQNHSDRSIHGELVSKGIP
mmetsp:Transcript_1184/g.1910  ORF Transcript_1184/g.1910 Transcript_1184/m.1910 type:complete len:93 (+) Transcript_1184:106-384(+)